MLRVSTKGEYGVRLMVDLARNFGTDPRSINDIADAEGLKKLYLEQLVRLLREHDLVVSIRGAHGGYRLSRPPEQIRMGDIVRALEGPIAPMICAPEGQMETVCDRLDCCSTKYLWGHVRDAITATLDAMTLADVLRETEESYAARAARTVATPVQFMRRSATRVARGTASSGASGASVATS